jgi:hypothetical protein
VSARLDWLAALLPSGVAESAVQTMHSEMEVLVFPVTTLTLENVEEPP